MNESPRPKIMVALPAYNEGQYIGSLVLQVKQYADEVVVVDDGSTDHTSEVAELAGAIVIRHGENKGKGVAVQRILAEASKRRADILVVLDADSQHNPEEIPALIQAVSEGSDLVIGSRKLQRSNIPRHRRIGQRVLSTFARILSGERLSDTESGFRALSKKAILEIQLKESGFAVETEMISAATAKGLRVTEVPTSVKYTKDGSTLHPVRHGFGVLNRIIVMLSERRPLLFFGFPGSVLVILGVISGITVMRNLYASDVLATGTALVSILLITVGVLSISTGIILNVLTRRIRDQL